LVRIESLDCFAQLVIGRRFAPTWLATTLKKKKGARLSALSF
jgi:hypothetical protein